MYYDKISEQKPQPVNFLGGPPETQNVWFI